MMRATSRWLAGIGAACLAIASTGCEAPPDAAVLKCSARNVAEVAVKKDCTIGIREFDHHASATVKIDTRRRLGFVRGQFTVQQGSVRVALRGSTDAGSTVVVSPDAPAILEGSVRLSHRDRAFVLTFDPEGQAAGLAGEVSFEAR
ncbi:hypothetical protein GCM10022229_04850 [Luteimonas lutimaris]|uniref:Lipoprotein n=2 Tax=Luteimonas lutimaris TaxID=698645 RepID=A0ABP7M7W2_9GAMM